MRIWEDDKLTTAKLNDKLLKSSVDCVVSTLTFSRARKELIVG